MSSTKGYYSIVQYCPDSSRLEAVNVGVVLFCPEIRWLKARFGRRRTRIRQLFGKQEWDFVELQQSAITARLDRERESFERLEDFETYISRRANALVLTSPRAVRVEDPDVELDHLLKRLVGSTERSLKPPSLTKALAHQLDLAGVTSKLRTDISVQPPALPKPIKVPLAFQNGKLNLIEPLQFEGQTSAKVFNKVSVSAVEGGLLADYKDPQYGDVGLVVVAKFGPDQEQDRKTAETIFEKHGVPMYTFDALQPLIQEIRQNAH